MIALVIKIVELLVTLKETLEPVHNSFCPLPSLPQQATLHMGERGLL